MANEDRIPGVVFHLESSETKKVKGQLVAEVKLNAHINDLDMFDVLVEKLDGLKVYASDDFQTQVNDLLREDNEGLESEVKSLKEYLHASNETLEQKVSLALEREKELQKENQTLMQRVDQLEVLERELQNLARA